ncbi:unnamed protein product [Prunus brigantina]
MYMPPVLFNLSQITTCICKRLKVPPNVFFEVPLRMLLFISPKIPEQQPLPFVTVHPTSFWAAISSSGHPKRRYGYQKNQHPLPTFVWMAEKSKKLAVFYPKSPLFIRAIPSTIFFDPGMIFQPLELFLLLVVLVRRNF